METHCIHHKYVGTMSCLSLEENDGQFLFLSTVATANIKGQI